MQTFFALFMTFVLFSGVSYSQETSKYGSEWLTYNGDFDAIRFSPLDQITPQNVESLIKVGEFTLPDTVPFQTGQIMVGRTIYLTTAFSTYAIDAVNGNLIWSHKTKGKGAVLDNNRGVAYANGKIFRSTLDADVFALDAKTGKEIWNVLAGNVALGEYCCATCIAWGWTNICCYCR